MATMSKKFIIIFNYTKPALKSGKDYSDVQALSRVFPWKMEKRLLVF